MQQLTDILKEHLRKPKTFITSDLHLEHRNIIDFCNRPFYDLDHMNCILVCNWNDTITNKDKVYHLGDLVYNFPLKRDPKKHKQRFNYWKRELNGKKTFIKGNHSPDLIKLKEKKILKYKGHKFYLTHRTEDVPSNWEDWAICGHHHNNDLEKYPFINRKDKRINICTELTKYHPVDMDDLIEIIESKDNYLLETLP